jgi:hypothetical protein
MQVFQVQPTAHPGHDLQCRYVALAKPRGMRHDIRSTPNGLQRRKTAAAKIGYAQEAWWQDRSNSFGRPHSKEGCVRWSSLLWNCRHETEQPDERKEMRHPEHKRAARPTKTNIPVKARRSLKLLDLKPKKNPKAGTASRVQSIQDGTGISKTRT